MTLPNAPGPTLDDKQISEGFARFLAQSVNPKRENFLTQLALLFPSDEIRDGLGPQNLDAGKKRRRHERRLDLIPTRGAAV
jgi:hypothetical protein